MATDEIRGALNRLRGWGDTIRHYNTRTVVSGGVDTPDEWVGHEEFFADLALLTQRLAAGDALAPESEARHACWSEGFDAGYESRNEEIARLTQRLTEVEAAHRPPHAAAHPTPELKG